MAAEKTDWAARLSVAAAAGLLVCHACLHVYGVVSLSPELEAPERRVGDLRATLIYASICALLSLGLVLRVRVAWALAMWLVMVMGVSELFSMLLRQGFVGIDRVPLAWYGPRLAWATALSVCGALVALLLPSTGRALK